MASHIIHQAYWHNLAIDSSRFTADRIKIFRLIHYQLPEDFERWPSYFKELFFKKPINYGETIQLFLFYVGNGGCPTTIASWIILSNWKHQKESQEITRISNYCTGRKYFSTCVCDRIF